MTERTLREKINDLMEIYDHTDGTAFVVKEHVLAIIDAHTAAQPAPDPTDLSWAREICDDPEKLDAFMEAHPLPDQPTPDAAAEAPVCRCGGVMSKNPHPEAGKPFTLLETGPVWVCIPCQSGALHRWAERANFAENRIAAAQEALTKEPRP